MIEESDLHDKSLGVSSDSESKPALDFENTTKEFVEHHQYDHQMADRLLALFNQLHQLGFSIQDLTNVYCEMIHTDDVRLGSHYIHYAKFEKMYTYRAGHGLVPDNSRMDYILKGPGYERSVIEYMRHQTLTLRGTAIPLNRFDISELSGSSFGATHRDEARHISFQRHEVETYTGAPVKFHTYYDADENVVHQEEEALEEATYNNREMQALQRARETRAEEQADSFLLRRKNILLESPRKQIDTWLTALKSGDSASLQAAYEVYGANSTTPIEAIHKIYRSLSSDLHPSRFKDAGEEEQKRYEVLFMVIAHAHEILQKADLQRIA